MWTKDLARAHRAGAALRAGMVWVNTYMQIYPTSPLGGFRQSGHSRQLGRASLEAFTQTKALWMKID